MDYDLIVSDIDGTLITRDNRLLPSTAKTLKDLINAGIHLATASARTKTNTAAVITELKGLCCAHAYVNGAFIETGDGEILLDQPIDADAVEKILDLCQQLQASVCCISVDAAAALVRHPECDKAFRLIHQDVNITAGLTAAMLDNYGLMVYAKTVQPLIEMIGAELPGLETSPISTIEKFGAGYIFIHAKGVNKGSALQRIAEHFHTAPPRTIAFGDAISNDGPLLQAAGLGVAMQNANPGLQELADQITARDHENDGVGDYLNKLFSLPA